MSKELLSLKLDYVFKHVFAEMSSHEVLAAFLKSILDIPEWEYDHLEIVDPHLQRRYKGDKLGILDVKVHTKSGTIIDIEIQIDPTIGFRKRVVFYASRMMAEQLGRGDDYEKTAKVVSIIITDFRLIEESGSYHNRFTLFDRKTGIEFSDALELHVLELPKLPERDDNSGLWEWLKFINSTEESEMAELAKRNPQIREAKISLREMSEDEAERMVAEAREKEQRDRRGAILYGEQEGEKRGKRKVARKLKTEGVSIEIIEKATGLSAAELEAM